MKYKNIFIIIGVAVAFTFSACKSSRTIVNSDGAVVQKSQEEVLDDALRAELDYKTISGKTSVEMKAAGSKSGMKINCYLKIVKDKNIQLSFRMPFINSEVVRINLTPDSVYLVDRLNKKYVAERIKDLDEKQNIQFNYYNVQALLTNTLFLPGKKQVSKKDYGDFDIRMSSGMFQIQTKDRSGTLYSFAVDANDRIASTLVYNEKKNFTVQWSYSDFIRDAASYVYPTNMNAKLDVKKKRVDLNISYSELEINKEITIDNQIPSKYQKSSISDILKSFIK